MRVSALAVAQCPFGAVDHFSSVGSYKQTSHRLAEARLSSAGLCAISRHLADMNNSL